MVSAVDKAIKQLDKGMLKLVKEHHAESFAENQGNGAQRSGDF
jgi:DNA-binding FrmR family transcriptional regulator